jgi:hypothetical protein
MLYSIRHILLTLLLTTTVAALYALREADNWIINPSWLNFSGNKGGGLKR